MNNSPAYFTNYNIVIFIYSGELPCERWNPTQNVRTILLSVISLLNEPNTFSPANVDASVMYRRWRDSNGRDNEYPNIIR
jgi:ubiquitin-conjugating enzyme E2 R